MYMYIYIYICIYTCSFARGSPNNIYVYITCAFCSPALLGFQIQKNQNIRGSFVICLNLKFKGFR